MPYRYNAALRLPSSRNLGRGSTYRRNSWSDNRDQFSYHHLLVFLLVSDRTLRFQIFDLKYKNLMHMAVAGPHHAFPQFAPGRDSRKKARHTRGFFGSLPGVSWSLERETGRTASRSPERKILFLASAWRRRWHFGKRSRMSLRTATTTGPASTTVATILPAHRVGSRRQCHAAGVHRPPPEPGSVQGMRAISSY